MTLPDAVSKTATSLRMDELHPLHLGTRLNCRPSDKAVMQSRIRKGRYRPQAAARRAPKRPLNSLKAAARKLVNGAVQLAYSTLCPITDK
ncbi:MAG: hypothetical protein ABIS29_06355, partial [Vicinamibacterales bacterium]